MGDYKNVPYKFLHEGLNVALPPDLIGENKYTRLCNIRNLQEGQLASRFGLKKTGYGTNCGWIVFMSKFGNGKWLFVLDNGEVFVEDTNLTIYDDVYGVGNRVGTDEDPNPESGTLPRFPLVLTDTDNISLVKYANSFAGEDWAFFATKDGMWKLDPNGIAYKWGIRPPKTISVDAEGLVSYNPAPLTPSVIDCPPDEEGDYGCYIDDVSTNTRPYTWVYTYYNSRTGSESNPCDEMSVQVTGIQPTDYDGSTLKKRGQAVKLTGFVKPTDPQVDRIRIYRNGGTLGLYLLEQEVPWDVTEFVSFRSDEFLGGSEKILSFGNDVPFTSTIPEDRVGEVPANYQEPPDDEFGVQAPLSVFETPMGTAWGPFAGAYIFAAGDPYRPSVVYWTNFPDGDGSGPDGSDDLNEVQVCANAEPIQAGFIYGGNPYVFTKDNLYALDGPTNSIPNFVPRQVPMGQGLSAPNAFAVGTQGVFFLSKDGIYATDCTSFSEAITQNSLRPIFLGMTASIGDEDEEEPELWPFDWDKVNETYMCVAAQELHFLYWSKNPTPQLVRRRRNGQETRRPIGQERVHLVYDILNKRWQRFKPSGDLDVAYIYPGENESQYRVYMALSDGYIYQVSDGFKAYSDGGQLVDFQEGDQIGKVVGQYSYPEALVPFECYVRTGAADLGAPHTHKEWGVLMVDANTYGKDVTITPMYDNETVTGESFVFNTQERQVLTFSLGDVYYKNMSLDIRWGGADSIGDKVVLYQVTALVRQDEEEIVHWEHPDTSMQIPGWKHIRDVYIGLRSTDTVRLRIEVDGTPYDYFLQSTDGQRRKVYVKLNPTKGKMFRFLLDSNFEYMDGDALVPKTGPPFFLYGDDSYYFVKPWHTGNTYTKVKLGGEGGAF